MSRLGLLRVSVPKHPALKSSVTQLSILLAAVLGSFIAPPLLASQAQSTTQTITQEITQAITQEITQDIEQTTHWSDSPRPAQQMVHSVARPTPQMMQLFDRPTQQTLEVNELGILAIALAGSAVIGLGLSAIVDRDRSAVSPIRLRGHLPRSVSSPRTTAASSAQLQLANTQLQRKLLRLLNGDRGAANRLFAQAKLKYPGESANWYAEKVIFDLERDRGRY